LEHLELARSQAAQEALRRSKEELERLVRERTRELERVNASLRQSEELFRVTFNESSIAQAQADPVTGRFLRVNPAFCRLTGYSEEELLQRTFSDITHPEEREADLERFKAFARGNALAYAREKHYVGRDGSVICGHVTATVLRDGTGRPVTAMAVIQDVSARKRAEEALRASESTLRSFYESAPLMMGVVEVPADNSDILHIYDNPATDRFFGRLRGSTVGQSALAMGAPEEAVRRWIENYRLAEREGRPVQFEYWHPRESGSVWLSAVVTLIGPGDTGQTRFSYVVADVTERKQGEEALKRSEARFRALVTGPGPIVFRATAAGWALEGPGGEAVTGQTREDHQGGGWFEGVHPEDLGRLRAEWLACMCSGKPADFDYRILARNGQWRWVHGYVVPVRGEDGAVLEWVGTVTDIHDRYVAEEAVRYSEERFRAFFDLAAAGTMEIDAATGRFVRVNDKYCELAGLSRQELLEMAHLDFTHPDDRALQVKLQEMVVRGEIEDYNLEMRYVRKDGRVVWVEAAMGLVRDAEGKPARIIGVVIDITGRKEFQAELQRLVDERTAKLQELVGELEHFSYTITHDLKSPLRAMRGFAEIANVMCGDCSRTEAREALAKISTSAERMECLITDALNYSRLVRQELPLTDVDTGALLRGMLDSYPELQPSKAHIQVAGKMPVVLGNEAGLTQCFSNLLENAVKFVKPGEKPHVRVWAEEREGWARIWVEDEGIGISKQMLPRVFDMFSRGSKNYEGTGVGLALVRKVAQRLGGRSGVESEEGRGSRFWIEVKSAQARPRAARTVSTPAEPKEGTVLYVEDEENDAMFMKMAFADQGMESALRVVGDGREALEYLSGTGKYADRKEYPLPSVMLLDLNLPQVSGFEVLRWMRNHPDFARTPVVVFSSSTREDDRVKALELGANEFVGKPSSGMKFAVVAEALRDKWMGALR
jgi:PAS domain S-box-containing protein